MGNELTAGRELDCLVAERVMGWKRQTYWAADHEQVGLFGPGGIREVNQVPAYSTSIEDAWQVVEKADLTVGRYDAENWYAEGYQKLANRAQRFQEVGPTAPLAICLASLRAVEGGAG